MMHRAYDPTKAGRQLYVAANGVELERKYLYGEPQEWEDMQNLARTLGLSVGRMLVLLAYAEIDRIRQSRYTQLQHASHR